MDNEDKNFDALDTHFEEWENLSKRMQYLTGPLLKQWEELQQAMQPFLDAQQKIQQQLEPILEEQNRTISSLHSMQKSQYSFPDLIQLIQPALDFQRSIQEQFDLGFENLHRTFSELSPRTRDALLLLGAHGWYLDLEMPLPELWKIKKMLSEGKVDEAETLLCEYYESKIEEIENSIIAKFPSRQKVINAAFEAHRRKEYVLSIPVFLAQSDGICKEVFKENYFRRSRNGKPRTAIFVEEIALDTYRAALLSPLAHNLPIMASEHERSDGFSELNRHMVLHGESLDYGTKINSIKSISLINYIAHVL